MNKSHVSKLSLYYMKWFNLIVVSTSTYYTNKPGLVSCLLTGSLASQLLSYAYNKRVFKVDHQVSHFESTGIDFIRVYGSYRTRVLSASLSLIVSGRTTKVYVTRPDEQITLLDKTADDSLGEAFDKGARILRLFKFNGGVVEYYSTIKLKQSEYFKTHTPLRTVISCSGLKTKLKGFVYFKGGNNILSVCSYFQNSIFKKVIHLLRTYINSFKVFKLSVSGGVIKNKFLIKNLFFITRSSGLSLTPSKKKYSEDNAVMLIYRG